MSGRTLYLIDGNSILYRSFYAIRGMATSKGFPTNAIYGFLATLDKLLEETAPDLLGVVFDAPGTKVRQEIFDGYKAQRKPMPEDLIKQIPRLKDVLRARRIPLYENSRYEADDVLGSLAHRAAEHDIDTVLVTSDKDLFQLVNARVTVFNPAKDARLDAEKVREQFGVRPDQVVDVLSLWGDLTDNIPGVPGVGEKTAKSLIQDFGSLDALLKDTSRIKNPRIRETIEKNLDQLEMSRRLATIERTLDVDFDLQAFALEPPDLEALVPLLQELEFGSLLAKIRPAPPKAEAVYGTVFDKTELAALAGKIAAAGFVSLDTETDNVSPTRANLVGMSFALEPDRAFYLPLRHSYMGAPDQIPVREALDILRPVLEDPAVRKIGQNIKYDALVLEREGVVLRGIDRDTMVLSYLLEPNWGQHGLDKLALAYLRRESIPFHDIVGKGKNQITMDHAPVEAVTPYACQDADFALALSGLLWPRLEAEGLVGVYEDLEKPLIGILAEMERLGVRIDEADLRKLSSEMEADLRRLEKEIHELTGTVFNINSPKQLGEILQTKLQLPLTRKTRGTKSISTAVDVLEEMAELHPVIPKILEFRQWAKLKSTYADALPALIDPETGRVHTSYNQTVASTGRLSSSDPNLQNIPARGAMGTRFRRAFIPADGFDFLAADYSQIELRVLAHMAGDEALIATFREGRDVHEETAARVFGPAEGLFKSENRRRAKIINFSVVYGTSAFSLAKQIETTPVEAQKFIDRYYETYPGVKAFLDAEVEKAKAGGFAMTLFGRKRPVPELRSPDRNVQQAGRRIALNMPIQGTAADLMKKAMIDIRGLLEGKKLRSRMILQVHDELVFEVPREERPTVEPLVRRAMEGVMESICEFRVPLQITLGWGPTWADCK
jgi:DNA polymerase I